MYHLELEERLSGSNNEWQKTGTISDTAQLRDYA